MSRPSLLELEQDLHLVLAQGQDPLPERGDFVVHSRSGDEDYEMLMVDGWAVHQGEGCLGTRFRGPLSCWHSRQFSQRGEDMTSLQTYQPHSTPAVRDFSPQDIETLKATICAGASDSELRLFIATCQHTGLDPFMRQIHAVMRSVKEDNVWVKRMTIQIGIDGYRLVADRTNKYQGSSEALWTYDGETWVAMPREDQPPLAAKIAVYRKGVPRPIIGFARWSACVQKTSTGEPNAIWRSRGPEQLAKCAEVQALRKAFPAEMAPLAGHPTYTEEDEEPVRDLPGDASVVDMKRPEQLEWEQTEAYRDAQAELDRVARIREQASAHGPGGSERREGEAVPPPAPSPSEPSSGTGDTPEGPTVPTPPAPTQDELRGRVKAMLDDCKGSWAAQDYLELGQELSIFMPEGEGRFVVSHLEGERLTACIEYLRSRRGELSLT